MLHVITTFFNYVNSETKIRLINKLRADSKSWQHSILYVVELSYNGQFVATEENNPNDLRMVYPSSLPPMFHKENLINIGIKRLLPADWEYCAWIDSDITVLTENWDLITAETLNVPFPFLVQPWSKFSDLGATGEVISIQKPFCMKTRTGHCGNLWAMNRKAYDQIGKLYDKAIVGSGDSIVSYALIGRNFSETHGEFMTESFQKDLKEYSEKFQDIDMGYCSSEIIHNYHGDKKHRSYFKRWEILKEYNPQTDVEYDCEGLLVPSTCMSAKLRKDLIEYFLSRKE